MPGALQAHAYQEYYKIRSELRSILQHLINLYPFQSRIQTAHLARRSPKALLKGIQDESESLDKDSCMNPYPWNERDSWSESLNDKGFMRIHRIHDERWATGSSRVRMGAALIYTTSFLL